ncbi:PLA2R phospholipase, partial [Polypterus senegalus]|nr:PLA2R phospholipase [Polypterus senegalus]
MKSKKTWSSAQNFCRESNSDLVTVESQEEVLKLYKLLPNSDEDSHVWIGLYQDKENWQWINGDQDSYFNWSKSSLQETNNFCAVLNRLGNWEKSDCNAENDVLCYKTDTLSNKKTYVLVDEEGSWLEAYLYCQKYYTDLVSISSDEENEEVRIHARGSQVWIGLINDPWKWSNGKNSTFRLKYVYNGKCMAMCYSSASRWHSLPCDTLNAFFCCKGKK